jgi:dTDP-4-dehydrorhamnose reductase
MSKHGNKCVLIVGAGGMLGHKLYQTLKNRYEVWGTLRSSVKNYLSYGIFNPNRIIDDVDVSRFDKLVQVVGDVHPDVVINCVGIIKQLPSAKDPIISLQFNSLFPHQLMNICKASRSRMFHISTDCVFSGQKGMYTEEDISDAYDLYGRTKYLGEVNQEDCLTLRTSIIGRELTTASGLVEWFLNNRNGKVKGFKNAIYTGFTTSALSDIICNLIDNHSHLSGVYQVSSSPINKYDLLCLIRDAFGVSIQIESETEFKVDRSLDSTRFRNAIGFQPPSWQQMIEEMAKDPTPYDTFRNK